MRRFHVSILDASLGPLDTLFALPALLALCAALCSKINQPDTPEPVRDGLYGN